MHGTSVPGVVVELAYPGVTQVTGGSNERGVRQDKISILHRLQYSQGVLGQSYAFEYLPRVGLGPVVDKVEEHVHLSQFLLSRLTAPLESNGAGFTLICPVVTCTFGQKTLAAAAPGTAAVTLEAGLVR